MSTQSQINYDHTLMTLALSSALADAEATALDATSRAEQAFEALLDAAPPRKNASASARLDRQLAVLHAARALHEAQRALSDAQALPRWVTVEIHTDADAYLTVGVA